MKPIVMTRRGLGRAALTALTTLTALTALTLTATGVFAQSNSPVQATDTAWPNRPIRLLVPFPPGGAADVFARSVGQPLGDKLKQPVVVENRPGAGGRIATQTAASAAPDGYTLLIVTVGHAVNPSLYGALPYDTLRDLQPLAMVATVPSMLVVNPSVPAKSVAELVALARKQPGRISYASSGNATTSHVAGAMLAAAAGVDLLHVPYKGSAPALTDLMSGQVSFMIDPIATAAPHVRSGKLVGLAVSSAERSPLAPELPTIAEAGVAGYDFSAWFILLAPSGVPAGIVNRIHSDVAQILRDEELVKNYASRGAQPGRGSPAELRIFLENEVRRYAKLVADTGMKPD